MSDRFLRAAQAGLLEVLQEAGRDQLNAADEDGMTPALWAASHGHTAALKLIVARGGDPDKSDLWGNSPLHLAAAHGHAHCLSFLVAFGANIWSLDNDLRTALDAAAEGGHVDCVRFLDAAAAKQITLNPKVASKLKERAFRAAERRIGDHARERRRRRRRMERRFMKEAAMMEKMDAASLSSYSSGSSRSNVSFSQATLLQRKLDKRRPHGGAFRVSEDGRRSMRSLSGLALGDDVLFLRPDRGRGHAVGEDAVSVTTSGSDTAVSAAMSDPGLWEGSEVSADSGRDSLFNRPGLGTVVFRRNYGPHRDHRGVGDHRDHRENGHRGDHRDYRENGDHRDRGENGDRGDHRGVRDLVDHRGFGDHRDRQDRRGHRDQGSQPPRHAPHAPPKGAVQEAVPGARRSSSPDSDLGSESVEGNWEHDQEQFLSSPLEVFMASLGLEDLTPVFAGEDLEALMLVSDEDLGRAPIPLGPRKRLMDALDRRLEALQLTAGPLEDTPL